ncbi:MAG TPA: DNA-binding response regulator [Cytophagales bacterium]|nr:DNA-binding response regulator [Cytophagales bacterium]HAA18203.1 DNA-binding response regulator [Cytophagales bacterium]HAP59217.1 DNA-binding response regulator [Cytophagales bacterium]
MNLRVLIVDDEYLARQRVLKLLESHEDVTVIGEARNAGEAIDMIQKMEPDVVFLDIQMPDQTGFDVVRRLKNPPYIIFATAYDQYALKAFDIHALDYLLKPFDEERFALALDQARVQVRLKRNSGFHDKLVGLLREFQDQPGDYRSQFEIKDRGRLFTVPTYEVVYLEAEGNYVALHTEKDKLLYRITMNTLEDELNPGEFLRIHRSLFINRHFVAECRYLNNNEYQFRMKSGHKLLSGRSYREAIQEYLNERDAET